MSAFHSGWCEIWHRLPCTCGGPFTRSPDAVAAAPGGVAGTPCREEAAATTHCAACKRAQDAARRLGINPFGFVCNLPDCSGAVAMSSETKTPSAEPGAKAAPMPTDADMLDAVCNLLDADDETRSAAKWVRELFAYAHPSPDVRDAERYRWLRSRSLAIVEGPYVEDGEGNPIDGTTLDRAIDTAIAKEKL